MLDSGNPFQVVSVAIATLGVRVAPFVSRHAQSILVRFGSSFNPRTRRSPSLAFDTRRSLGPRHRRLRPPRRSRNRLPLCHFAPTASPFLFGRPPCARGRLGRRDIRSKEGQESRDMDRDRRGRIDRDAEQSRRYGSEELFRLKRSQAQSALGQHTFSSSLLLCTSRSSRSTKQTRNFEMFYSEPSSIVHCDATRSNSGQDPCIVALDGITYPNGDCAFRLYKVVLRLTPKRRKSKVSHALKTHRRFLSPRP